MKRVSIEFNENKTLATVKLTRADKHNGVDWQMLKDVKAAQKTLAKSKDLRAVVLCGDGPSFCAGLDVKSVMSNPKIGAWMYANLWLPFRNIFQTWSVGWRELPVPVIAVIHGNTFGAGLQLALGADIRVAAPDSKISLMEAKWGLVPDMGGCALLRELIPLDKAKEITFTGRVMSAQDALEMGLVSYLDADPMSKAYALIHEMLERSPDSLAAGKFMLQNIWGLDEGEHLTQERRWQRRVLGFKNQRLSIAKNSGKGKEVQFARRQIKA